MSKTARTPYKTKEEKRKDVRATRAVKNSVSGNSLQFIIINYVSTIEEFIIKMFIMFITI